MPYYLEFCLSGRREKMKISYLVLNALLIFICSCSREDKKNVVNQEVTPSMPVISSTGNSGKSGSCLVKIEDVNTWRNFMPSPVKGNRHSDGGSPLYVSAKVIMDNSKGPPTELTWKAYVFEIDADKYHALELIDKNGKPKWTGEVPGSVVQKIELITHDGPPLKVGSRVIILFQFKNKEGLSLWVKSKEKKIRRTY